jgi:stage III sporulation protein AG
LKDKGQEAEDVLSSNGVYDHIEIKMKSILSKIDGAGEVDVMITYVSGAEIVPAVDLKKSDSSTQEKDTGGGTRNVDQHDYESEIVYYEKTDGCKTPVVIKDLQPVIKGVIVVAKGGDNPQVKEKLTKAVQVLVDIPVHRIQVFKSK